MKKKMIFPRADLILDFGLPDYRLSTKTDHLSLTMSKMDKQKTDNICNISPSAYSLSKERIISS